VAARCNCPRITGYLVVGMLFSPSLFNVIGKESLHDMRVFTTLALGLIAFEIGASLRMGSLRSSGKPLFWITTLQVLFPWIISTVLITLLAPWMLELPDAALLTTYLPIGLLLGAMACPTAPAITVALVHECKSQGPVTSLLFAVVALTDAIAIIAYSAAAGISRHLVHGGKGLALQPMILDPLQEIILSTAIGLVLAVLLIFLSRYFQSRSLQMVLVVGISLLCTGLCEVLGASALLANMALGFVAVNRRSEQDSVAILGKIEGIVFTAFFVISGLYFSLEAMKGAGWMTLVIILCRCSGKYLGANLGARIGGASDVVRRYFGLALLPKAGLVIGLAIAARASFPDLGLILFNGMLASVVVNTLLTPPLAKYALARLGECRRQT